MRFMTEPIACPRCRHADLTSGVIVGRSPGVKFKRTKGVSGDLTGVPVTTGFLNHSAPALRCAECGTVIVLPAR